MPVPTLTYLLTWGMAHLFEVSYAVLNADQRKHALIDQARTALPAMGGQPVDAVLYQYLLTEYELSDGRLPAALPFPVFSE